MLRVFLPLPLCILLQACSGAASDDVLSDLDVQRAAAAIQAQAMRDVVVEISGDAYGGRAPGSDGDRATRSYLAERMQALGFVPGAANGQWDQPFALIGLNAQQPQQWSFARDGDEIALAQDEEFIVASAAQRSRVDVKDAELVFVGFGIEAPEYDWNDFAGMDLSGKVLVMLNNDPDWDPALFAGDERLYYGRWSYKYESAARQGAVGAIIVHTTASAGYPWQVVRTSWSGEQFQLPADGAGELQFEAWTTETATRRLMSLAGQDWDALAASARSRDFQPVPLGVTTSIAFDTVLSRTESANVIGVMHGSDPVLANEFVIYTAHHDHLGQSDSRQVSADEDSLYNGARDNASGVAMVLGIGAAFAALPEPPRRSVMLLFVGAEEQGLLGSQYFAAYPTVAPGRIAANVNYDSGNIWGRTSDITFVGFGKSSLDGVAEAVAVHQQRVVKADQEPDQGSYYRSDQFSFAKIGVPAFYFKVGTEFIARPAGWGQQRIDAYNDVDYHQPSDEYSADWNLEGMIEDAQFGFFAGLIVANADAIPQWVPGDEFEAARRAAIAELESLSAR
jgi:Zn-dependent M28 family amino/carboxypeptidase